MKKILFTSILIFISLFTISIAADTVVDPFENWKAKFGADIKPSELVYRKNIFKQNLDKITKHNQNSSNTYKMAANQFSILTQSEFKLLFLTKMNMPSGSKVIVNTTNTTNTTANTTRKLQTVQIDWSKVNGVSSVRNQGQCGSCWAFTAAATLQSFSLIYKKQNIDLSEQQLVDCSISFGNSGCNGGWPSNALKYVQAYGLTTQSTYPYYGYLRRCSKIGGTFKISKIVYANGCQGLMTNLALNPIGVAVDATYWQYYGSGIFNYCNNYVNHAVLLVGVVSGNWKIKNSWGATWGQNGYIRLAPGNTCGICDYSGSFPQ